MNKQVIIDSTPPPQHLIHIDNLNLWLGQVVVARNVNSDGKVDKFILAHHGNEFESGYIFHYWDGGAGHSGRHQSPHAAIRHAIQSVPSTQVFVYDSLKEAINNFFNA